MAMAYHFSWAVEGLWFNCPEGLKLVLDHKAPDNERAIAKDIPLTAENLAIVRKMSKHVRSPAGDRLRIRYRGERKDWMALTSKKTDANRFALYLCKR